MKIDFSPPDIREEDIAAVVDVLRSGWITTGPVAAQFEQKVAQLSGTAGAMALSSCTSALEFGLRCAKVGPGDQVIVPGYTYTASPSPVVHLGADLVLVDSEPHGSHYPRTVP